MIRRLENAMAIVEASLKNDEKAVEVLVALECGATVTFQEALSAGIYQYF